MPVIWFLFCGLVGYYASEKGRSGILWFILAVIISPLLAGIVLGLSKDLSVEEKIDDLDKTTENIKREVEYRSKHQQRETESVKNRLTTSKREKKRDLAGGSQLALDDNTIKCQECGRLNDKGVSFCPSCGEKVLPSDKQECFNCEAIIAKDNRFCPECGIELVKTCPECEAEVNDEMKFCTSCGFALEDTVTLDNDESDSENFEQDSTYN